MHGDRLDFTRHESDPRWTLLGLTPFEEPDARLAIAFARGGGVAILDLGRDVAAAAAVLAVSTGKMSHGFGIRIPSGAASTLGLLTGDLPEHVRLIVVDGDDRTALTVASAFCAASSRALLVQVTSIFEAKSAAEKGAAGLIVKGHEAGGRVGDETAFVLVQRVQRVVTLPIWVQGGVGIHSASACIAAGARGVVLDSQLALVAESSARPHVRELVAAMDGSETTLSGGHRVYARPDLFALPRGRAPEKVAEHLGTADLSRQLLSVGQDGAFAAPFAQKFRTARGVVRGLHAAIAAHLRQARALEPLAEGASLARSHAIRFPIAQGPMTRVSDRASFADAVSRGGALPFIALSLLRKNEARALLEETARLLAGRTWGVGVLGFLPAEIREEQLALLTELRPPVALIAGGRPSQAMPLEAVGISTYLHVPSPGLLDLFLKDGARKFVFEGHECGGHVGPRSSFVLWELCIARLLAQEALADVSVLFAGGIHDDVSAAMVTALAAPLAARGAKIGVLMGTAYLFTHEAVATGAIGAAFQQEAARCEKTVLLETAPGHATRCADSEYAHVFDQERGRLERARVKSREKWEALEQLNLGRLRVASKGLVREDGELVAVSEETQHTDGMFMIGQVAALRESTLSIAALHDQVCLGSTERLRNVQPPAALVSDEKRVDVAIVGMASIFPGAGDTAEYWKNIVFGNDAISEVPAERWNHAAHFEIGGTGDKSASKWGGFLPDVIFEPSSFGIPPRSLAAIDPAQLLSVEVARRALDDAGYGTRAFDRERASVIFGAESGTDLANAYAFRATYRHYLGELPEALDAVLPTLTEDSFPGILSNVIAGRIANRLDLGGVNYTVDAACASSLAALDLACKELASGTSDLVISGGADLHNSINDYLFFSSVHALSPTGRCRTFDANADGIALGEGVAAVVLKRLEDAEQDGDRIYAVIKGVGGSSDGKSLGLTAPRKEGQVRALERAYDRAGISAADVGLIEAHGTGTVVGDKTELATLHEFFEDAGATAQSCTLGSVKSQIGHTKCAAGLAGLIKAALAIHHRVLPPTANLFAPNGAYRAVGSPFAFRKSSAPWVDPIRRAGVSAFGFGGTNFHVVLESHAQEIPASGVDAWPSELFLFHALDAAALDASVKLVQSRLDDAAVSLRNLAASVSIRNVEQPVRAAVVASSVADLRFKLDALLAKRDVASVFVTDSKATFSEGEVAFIFPGQGSQRTGMLADLFVAFPFLHEKAALGKSILGRMFPAAAFSPQRAASQREQITDTRVAQPALGIADLAMNALFDRVGVRPGMVAGHSYGELVALTVAGVFSEAELIALSHARADSILAAAGEFPGKMASVRAPAAAVAHAIGDIEGVVVANCNAPDQTVIAGSAAAVALASAQLEGAHRVRSIPVACAFHSPVVAKASIRFAEALAGLGTSPTIPVYANTTAAPYPNDLPALRDLLAHQLAKPVLFEQQIEAMHAAGARVFVEVGPGGVLTDLVARILGDRAHVAIASDSSSTDGITAFLVALARLATSGIAVDLAPLFAARSVTSFALEAAQHIPSSTAWVVNGQTARPLHGPLPENAMHILTEPLTIAQITPATPATSVAMPLEQRDEAVVEYLRSMRELVDGQRQVMLRYLGESAPVTLRETPREPSRVEAPRPEKRKSPFKKAILEPEPPAAASATPMETLVAVVSQRTGYPADMLELDLDLEADLGIDSIKRIEILGLVSEKLGLKLVANGARSQIIEELATVKTLRGIGAWLEKRVTGSTALDASAAAPIAPITAVSLGGVEAAPVSTRAPVERYVLEVVAIAAARANCVTVRGKKFAIAPDEAGVAIELVRALEARGAEARILGADEALGKVDGLLYLGTSGDDSSSAMKGLFSRAKDAIAEDANWIVATTGLGGDFGRRAGVAHAAAVAGGVNGLLKSISKEQPERRIHTIDLERNVDPARSADRICDELLADDRRHEVGYRGESRLALQVISGAPRSTRQSLELDSSAVVLITGGARGITAQVAVALARRFHCRLELVGRSPLPETTEDPSFADAAEIAALRALLIARANGAGSTSPAVIDAMAREILGAREIRATLEAIRAAGGSARYHAVDVRDSEKLGALVEALYAEHGHLDGVIHGAGLIEDKLAHHKTHESFARVFDTKVASALTLVERLRDDVRFIAFFSSVSGAFGNRGQSDYAAANAALDALAHNLRSTRTTRVLSVNWGPWAGAGMVRPELEAEYARQGVALIAPEDGAGRFLDELCDGDDTQVILSATPPSELVS